MCFSRAFISIPRKPNSRIATESQVSSDSWFLGFFPVKTGGMIVAATKAKVTWSAICVTQTS